MTICLSASLFLSDAADLAARSRPAGQLERITASARIKRGRARRARTVATYRALRAVVWQRTEPLLASKKGRGRLKRRLGRNVRRLIKWYRTRKVARSGRWIKVTLAVIVDMAAVRLRLKTLGARLKLPGVLLLEGCAEADLSKPLTRSLRAAGIRVISGSWAAASRPALVRAALQSPAKALKRAREAHAVAVVLASCQVQAKGRIAAAGVVSARGKIQVVAYAPGAGGQPQRLLRLEARAFGHHADPKQAGKAALLAAGSKLGPRLEGALPHRLPAGAARTLFVRLRGGLGLGSQLRLIRRMAAELRGVATVKPVRFGRGETWLTVRTVHDPTRLKKALSTLKPPSGWRFTVGAGPKPGWLDLKAELAEDS